MVLFSISSELSAAIMTIRLGIVIAVTVATGLGGSGCSRSGVGMLADSDDGSRANNGPKQADNDIDGDGTASIGGSQASGGTSSVLAGAGGSGARGMGT